MAYQLLAGATVATHVAFLAYLVIGGFLAWPRRFRWTILPHALVCGWGIWIVTVGQECPLTHLEDWARRQAGQEGLPHGFIDTYLTGVIYPEQYLTEVRLLVAAVVLVSWFGLLMRIRHARFAAVLSR